VPSPELPADFPPEVLARVAEAISSAPEEDRAKAAVAALLAACEVVPEYMQVRSGGWDSGVWLRWERPVGRLDDWRARNRLVLYLPPVEEPAEPADITGEVDGG